MEASRDRDRAHLLDIPKDQLVELLFLQIRNLWSEDGLYFLGIEKQYGTEAAMEIDRNVWSVMGKLEARRLKSLLKPKGNGINELFDLLKHTSWWLDLENKEYELKDNYLTITNRKCRVHITRQKKGLATFDCKSVRWGFLKSFVAELNPDIKVNCHFCPPGHHPEDAWCEWEISLICR